MWTYFETAVKLGARGKNMSMILNETPATCGNYNLDLREVDDNYLVRFVEELEDIHLNSDD